jgi:hypothetical protein
MSVIEYQYQRATHEQLVKCLRWCQNQLQLRDWKIDIFTGEMPPAKLQEEPEVLCLYGMQVGSLETLEATIWVNTPKLQKDKRNPYSTVIHEACHCMLQARHEDSEIIVRILEPILYRLYIKEMGLKQAKEKATCN